MTPGNSSRRIYGRALAALVLIIGCGRGAPLVSRPANASRSIVLRNVRVFDAPNARLADGMRDVVVRDGIIETVGAPGVAAAGIAAVDAGGRVLLPGLVDVHTHTGAASYPAWRVAIPDIADNLAAFLYAGVTTVLDLGSLSPEVFRERERLATGARLGPRLYAAGPIFTAPGGHPIEVFDVWMPWYLRWYVVPRATRQVGTPEEARRAVEALLPERPDVLKIADDAGTGDVPRLRPETMAALTSAAHAAHVRVIVHIGSSTEAIDAVRGGADALAHAPWRDELSDEAVAVIARGRVPVVATLTVWDLLGTPRTRASDFLPIERDVARSDLIGALLAAPPALDPGTTAVLQAAAAGHDARRRNVARLRAAGVPVLVGSDACNPGDLPGAGLHVELAKLVEAGFTAGEALRAATWENARFLAGEHADFGEVAAGKRADLVLVDGDPTRDISAASRIARVVLGGASLERHEPAQ